MHSFDPSRLALLLAAAGALATPWQRAAAETDAVELDTLTVTARRGVEQIREIPFSVSVVSGDALETGRLVDIEEALRQTPGVDVNSWGGVNDANIRIRGVGSLYQVNADDTSVVLNMDGVPMSSRHASMATLDVERLEILKGPQGTLFGRNSEAGAINVTSRRPTRETDGHARIEVGQDGQQLQEAAVGGALSEQVAARLAVRHAAADNPIENLRTGKPATYERDFAGRASLLWEIASGTTALWISERQVMRDHIGMMILRPYGDDPAIDISPAGIDGNEKTVERHSLEFNQDLAWGRLTSITSLVSVDTEIAKGYGTRETEALYGMAVDYLATDSGAEDSLNQDLRLSSLPGADVFWVAGLDIARSRRDFDSTEVLPGKRYDRRFDTHSDALYGEITYPLADAWKLTGGWRHSWDRKDYSARYSTLDGITDDRRRLSDSYDTGRLALSHALTPSTNLYGVVSRGYKSGGFNDYATQVLDSEPYRAAVANSAEIGFKAASPDGALTLNGALFFNRVQDDHLLGFDFQTMATYAVNADTESRGAELEGTWRAGPGLSLSGGISYTDATITSDVKGVDGGPVDAGNRVPDVPRWSGVLSASYQQAVPDMLGLSAPVLNLRASHRYVGPRTADAQNHFDLDAYHKLDLHLGLMVGSAEVYLWGDNLLDEEYDLFGYYFTPTVTVGLPARGRVLGLGVTYVF